MQYMVFFLFKNFTIRADKVDFPDPGGPAIAVILLLKLPPKLISLVSSKNET